MGFDRELDDFKKRINLTEFAAARGYVIDRQESSQNSVVMRHPDGDKIIVVRNTNGDWVFFSVRDDRDNGSIIDFVQWRGGGKLGEVRKALRGWLGTARAPLPLESYVPDLLPVSRDRAAVLTAWNRARPCALHPYLTGRGLGPAVLGLPQFLGCVRRDPRGNAIFPHWDRDGLCGFEIKNQGFTGFSAGGTKGLWFSKIVGAVRVLVFCESAIDAMSYHVLNPSDEARYLSTGGALSNLQPELIRAAMEKLPPGAVVVLAFDNDEGGERLTEDITALAPAAVPIRRALPPVGAKDWNDALKEQKGLSLHESPPTSPVGPDLDFYAGRSPRFGKVGGLHHEESPKPEGGKPKNRR